MHIPALLSPVPESSSAIPLSFLAVALVIGVIVLGGYGLNCATKSRKLRGTVFILLALIPAGGATAAIVAIGNTSDARDVAVNGWIDDVASWAADRYDVTAGIEDIRSSEHPDTIFGLEAGDALRPQKDYFTTVMTADGQIKDVKLMWIGKQPILVEATKSEKPTELARADK